jgi:Protein phosphatase 2C
VPLKTPGGACYSSFAYHTTSSLIGPSLGDLKWKPLGVTAEPEVKTKLIEGQCKYTQGSYRVLMFDLRLTGSKWAFMVLISDGISSVVSDQEIVDLARGATDPRRAAQRILSFAEEMGSSDNLTAIVLPFAGWGSVSGPDRTQKLREYRSSQMSQSNPFVRKCGLSNLGGTLQLALSGRSGCSFFFDSGSPATFTLFSNARISRDCAPLIFQ